MRRFFVILVTCLCACTARDEASRWDVSCRDGIGEYYHQVVDEQPTWYGEKYGLSTPTGWVYVPATCIISEVKSWSPSYR